jgi:nucleoside phosphorylase
MLRHTQHEKLSEKQKRMSSTLLLFTYFPSSFIIMDPDAYSDYSVGIVCSGVETMAALIGMLDHEYDGPPNPRGDDNKYQFGAIANHNVVISALPAGYTGSTAAAGVGSNMKSSFPKLQICLLLGVGSGFPTAQSDIRLGDIVASGPSTTHSGLLTYKIDYAPSTSTMPSSLLQCTVRRIQHMYEKNGGHKLSGHIDDLSKRYPKMQEDFCDPPEEFDTRRGRFIHYGYIASGNQVFESREDRDQLVKQFPGLLCLEREALGLIALFPGSLHVVQGVCNLGDSEQPDHWMKFSASAAAAYAKDFISSTTDVSVDYEEKEGTPVKSYSAINFEAPTLLPVRLRESGIIAGGEWILV